MVKTGCTCSHGARFWAGLFFPSRWKEAGLLQTCAPKNNDDWYWLHAAVYTGGKVLVLTNDEMRDHHFSMLSHRSFERWKERHQVTGAITHI